MQQLLHQYCTLNGGDSDDSHVDHQLTTERLGGGVVCGDVRKDVVNVDHGVRRCNAGAAEVEETRGWRLRCRDDRYWRDMESGGGGIDSGSVLNSRKFEGAGREFDWSSSSNSTPPTPLLICTWDTSQGAEVRGDPRRYGGRGQVGNKTKS
ncbi:hypothetical protein C8J56DRAFT_898862 [Mycena floridula]|nr:hypothetical protein C8J56DRAFT_898862 [Mycena floridula]